MRLATNTEHLLHDILQALIRIDEKLKEQPKVEIKAEDIQPESPKARKTK